MDKLLQLSEVTYEEKMATIKIGNDYKLGELQEKVSEQTAEN